MFLLTGKIIRNGQNEPSPPSTSYAYQMNKSILEKLYEAEENKKLAMNSEFFIYKQHAPSSIEGKMKENVSLLGKEEVGLDFGESQ